MVAVGSIIAGKVAKVTNYGAFVDLEGGGSGMIHISEVANTYVKDINDYLHVGEEVTVKVIGINEQGKVSLSIKETMQKGPQQSQGQGQGQGQRREGGRPQGRSGYVPRSFNRPAQVPSTGDAFEDMLSRYKRSSDDRMSDLKKVMDTRRGSANRRSRSKG